MAAPKPPSCHHLIEHTALFHKKIYAVGSAPVETDRNVFVCVGYNLANITFVRAPRGWVVIDTGQDIKQMSDVWKEFNDYLPAHQRNQKVTAVILTHHHADHVGGTSYLVDNHLFVDDVVEIYGADNLDKEYQQENGLISPLMTCRALAQYNNLLLKSGNSDDTKNMNSGIGPIISFGQIGYIKPGPHDYNLIPTSSPFNPIKMKIGGVFFDVVHVPSEANSEIALYLHHVLKDFKDLPEDILFSAEVIQDHSFPNLYTLRGSNFRDPSNWYQSIDCFLNNWSNAKHMVLQHGPPIQKDDINSGPLDFTSYPIKEVLTRYRDAIQYVRDQTLRWALKGYAKDEIIHLVHLPDSQANFSPWLKEFYGTVKHSVPAVYNGYIGWFDGDPVALNPLPRSIAAKRMVELMGGREAVLKKGKEAYILGVEIAKPANEKSQDSKESIELLELAHQEWQFAAELATLLIRERAYDVHQLNKDAQHDQLSHLLHLKDSDGDDLWWEARRLKGSCFMQMGYRNICANWRGTYLTASYELEGNYLTHHATNQMRVAEKLNYANLNVENTISELQIRVSPKACKELDPNKYPTLIFLIEEKNGVEKPEKYRLEIRNSVLIATKFEGAIPHHDIKISGTTKALNQLLCGDKKKGYAGVLDNDRYGLKVAPAEKHQEAVNFFSYFDGGKLTSFTNIYVH